MKFLDKNDFLEITLSVQVLLLADFSEPAFKKSISVSAFLSDKIVRGDGDSFFQVPSSLQSPSP